MRLKLGGGEGGHNGLRSISKSLGTSDYLRVRVGIGRPPGRMDPAAFVLQGLLRRPSAPSCRSCSSDGADAAERLLAVGLEAAQQDFHSR